jgi:hypothetical protein
MSSSAQGYESPRVIDLGAFAELTQMIDKPGKEMGTGSGSKA